MAHQHDYIVQLCDHHAIRFSSSHYAFMTIKEALRQKGTCNSCALDMPETIKSVKIEFHDDVNDFEV